LSGTAQRGHGRVGERAVLGTQILDVDAEL